MLSLDPNGKIIIAGDIIQLPVLMGHFFSFSRLIVQSDHWTVLVQPRIGTKPTRKFFNFHDVKKHCKIKMENKFNNFDWKQGIVNPEDPPESVRL